MCGRQAVGGPVVTVNLELLCAVHALEVCEPLQGHLGRASHELQEPCSVCLVKGAQGTPEPLDLHRITDDNT